MSKERACRVCNKTILSTDTDIVHLNLHLGCSLKEETKGKGIKEQYLEASEELFKTESKFSEWPRLPRLRGNK